MCIRFEWCSWTTVGSVEPSLVPKRGRTGIGLIRYYTPIARPASPRHAPPRPAPPRHAAQHAGRCTFCSQRPSFIPNRAIACFAEAEGRPSMCLRLSPPLPSFQSATSSSLCTPDLHITASCASHFYFAGHGSGLSGFPRTG